MLPELMIENEAFIRLVCFISIFAVMAFWEFAKPCRTLTLNKPRRWLNNIGLAFINSMLLRLVFPTAALGIALFAETNNLGLLHQFNLPSWITLPLSIIIMDCIIYQQHVLFHRYPLLWRVHQVHHTDIDYDVTTGVRFHPLEILLSMLVKGVTILMLGPPLLAVLIFEILLNGTALFNHSNIALPKMIDTLLRKIVVTPDMHRVHHSVDATEMNRNFGFNFSFWDRLFGTYLDQPKISQATMPVGLADHRDSKIVNRLNGLLRMPLISTQTRNKTQNGK